MLVYRVQNAASEGPYRNFVGFDSTDWLDPARHPVPTRDFGALAPDDANYLDDISAFYDVVRPYKFAFPTRLAARRWFGIDGMLKLAQAGFYLVEVEAEEVLVSDSGRQCIYRPKPQKGPTTYIDEPLSLPA